MDHCMLERNLLTRVLPPLLVFEFVLGVLGNGLALWVFCCHMKPWKSSTVFLFNLTLADFLLSIGLPFRVCYYLADMDWNFGDAMCRVSLFMLAMNRKGSIFFLTVVAVDRYMRVVHPYHWLNSINVTKAFGLAGMVWAVTFSLNAHFLYNSNLFEEGETAKCEGFTPKNNVHSTIFVLVFLLALITILFCTARTFRQLHARGLTEQARIRRVMRCLATVTIMFAVCFLPSNITRVLILLSKVQQGETDCQGDHALETAFHMTISLTYLNSMLDPVVYYFSSPSFKRICNDRVKRCRRRQSIK